MSNAGQLKLAFVGCGGIAQAHWRGIQAIALDIQVTAAVDTNTKRAQAMAEQTGGRPFTSLTEALAQGDFNAVDIMLPHNQHEESAVTAFRAGKHVLLEKPMSTTLDSCDRIMAAAAEAGIVFAIAEQAQFWADAVKVRELLQDGAIGDVITARAYFGGRAGTGWGSKPWRYDKAITGGGIVIDGGSHTIRPLRMWFGEIEEVVAVTGHPLADMEGESLARALLRFSSGLVVGFDALRAGSFHGPGEEFRITGTEGELVIEKGKNGRLVRYTRDHTDGEVILDNKADGRNAAFGYELLDFQRAVLEGTPTATTAEYATGELRTALAIYRSAESRQWEKVWDCL